MTTLTRFRLKYLFLFFVTIFVIGCVFSIITLSEGESERCKCYESPANRGSAEAVVGVHLLGVVVPFRDRFDELIEFIPHIHHFLSNQSVPHKIFIVNQADEYRFNRGSLINVGFREAVSAGCDYIAMHDVDLLPLNPSLDYSYPQSGVFHVASPQLHPRYHYSSFIGGILLVTREDYVKVNGMSNRYWGWGLEDDEFFVRLKSSGIAVNRPVNITSTHRDTFRHNHRGSKRKRDTAKCYNQKEVTRRRDRETGLSTLSFVIVSSHSLTVDSISATLVNTRLHCNTTATPWCVCPPTS